jgi:hypothetical protein
MILFRSFLVVALTFMAVQSHAADESRKERRERKMAERQEAARMGDPIGFTISKASELKLNAQQVAFLKQLKTRMTAEREKDKDEQSMKQVFADASVSRKKDPETFRAQREMYKLLADKQAKKWEEREMSELEKLLPKPTFTKLKELRGESVPEVDNPFGND